MGSIVSVLNAFSKLIYYIRASAHSLEYIPINYRRADDYALDGQMRLECGALDRWDQALEDYITRDLRTRRALYPVINKRMNRIEARLKYTSSNMEELLDQFIGWTENKILECHDLFQVFEIDGDGLIDIPEMVFALDSLGDETSLEERFEVFMEIDRDETGSIDFEEFLSMIYLHEFDPYFRKRSLAKTLQQVNIDLKFIRSLSVCQQLSGGFL